MVFFLMQFRQYILGRKFLVNMDSGALQWLSKTPNPMGQQVRWLEISEEFNFTIEQRPGGKHSNADHADNVDCVGWGSATTSQTITLRRKPHIPQGMGPKPQD